MSKFHGVEGVCCARLTFGIVIKVTKMEVSHPSRIHKELKLIRQAQLSKSEWGNLNGNEFPVSWRFHGEAGDPMVGFLG